MNRKRVLFLLGKKKCRLQASGLESKSTRWPREKQSESRERFLTLSKHVPLPALLDAMPLILYL